MEIWIIIIIIILLAIIAMYYFGLFRYIWMHSNSPDNYIKQYSSVPEKTKKKVVISLTTTPNRIKYLKPFINSILDQTARVNQIYLNIPEKYEIDFPEYLKDVVSIMKCGRDYGEATKFIPTVLREHDSDTILIFLSDNYVYGKDFIETLLKQHEKDPYATILSGYGILTIPANIDAKAILNPDIKESLSNSWITSVLKNKKYVSYSKNFKSVF